MPDTVPDFATLWNDWLRSVLDPLLRNRILSVLSNNAGGWQHPFQVNAQWSPEAEQWQAAVEPGFVNGLEVTFKDQSLVDAPAIPLASFRAIGEGAPAISSTTDEAGQVTLAFEEVPPFFAALGVQGHTSLTLNADNPSSDQSAIRLLRAADIVLHHDRPALASALITGQGTDGAFVNVAAIAKTRPNARDHGYLSASALFSRPVAPDALQQLQGLWADDSADSQLVATVYLLSPENADPDEGIGPDWQAFVKNEIFWNLLYSHSYNPPAPNTPPQVLNTGLAAGLLDQIGNTILASINDAASAVNTFLANQRITGMFWTV